VEVDAGLCGEFVREPGVKAGVAQDAPSPVDHVARDEHVWFAHRGRPTLTELIAPDTLGKTRAAADAKLDMTNAITAALRPRTAPTRDTLRADPAAQAFLLLRIAFTVAPIVMGLDKFANVLTDDWTRYLAPVFNDIIPGSAADAMHIVGVIEIVAGLVVATMPRFGALLVAGWLAGIIVNLLIVGGYGDIAFRDFGLLLGALTLARLAWAYGGATDPRSHH
jgi:hypothetical protein